MMRRRWVLEVRVIDTGDVVGGSEYFWLLRSARAYERLMVHRFGMDRRFHYQVQRVGQ